MSYAIVRTGGKQFHVEPGAKLRVPSIEGDVNSQIELETMLVTGDGDVKFGESIGGAVVKATVLSHGRGDKIIVFKKKRRKQYKRKQGHRQGYTEIQIDSIG
ncbi:MAG TPA: 50S ribosomal protein L21 [Pyrinomonadaceae bacterium]|jgi:large subunit ribosomal protein L21|nr:50S ribosomal protein L21 [Pyrinomonadaceae bacterium]